KYCKMRLRGICCTSICKREALRRSFNGIAGSYAPDRGNGADFMRAAGVVAEGTRGESRG
ncbi:MAG: hypothetical protein ABSA33_05920, partial [Candidatus Micrarchaeaceae archaeon]